MLARTRSASLRSLPHDGCADDADPARDFYVAVFGYTLDVNPDMPELDFTFLDGHEIGGIAGDPKATRRDRGRPDTTANMNCVR